MTPNPYICIRNIACPHRWNSSMKKSETEDHYQIEHWESPVPGTYEFIPGRGWYLARRDSESASTASSLSSISSPSTKTSNSTKSSKSSKYLSNSKEEVRYCRVLHRYLLASELESRCRWEQVMRWQGAKPTRARFFQLDDGIAWVLCWDEKGRFIHGPYRRWCLDKETGAMRPMKTDDLDR